ncbi:MAG: extracellular solute-binding protein [Verrucomicrobiales bacterium]
MVYCSQDQVYAEQLFKDFEQETGVKARPVFDTESVKTAGLANRLRFEKNNPQCDLFWSNEEMHTRALASEGLFSSETPWQTIGYRGRKLIYNTNKVSIAELPKTLTELTNSTWLGKFAIAFPLFGTTSYHFLALRQEWGDQAWLDWCGGLVRNQTKVVDGNSMVVKMVGSGESIIGLTDSDDLAAGLSQGFPIAEHVIEEATLFIPNTVALIRGASQSPEAAQLASYLAKPATVQKLVKVGALEGEVAPTNQPSLMVDWRSANVEETMDLLRKAFLRQ